MSSQPPIGSSHYGILVEHPLPNDEWTDRWERIVVDPSIKDRMINFAAYALTQREARSQIALPVHGLLLLQGPPGTGKTTLGRGLADQVARLLTAEGHGETLYCEIDGHGIGSGVLGESQKQMDRVFQKSIRTLARRKQPLVVLLDEVENLAVARNKASLEANPMDVHRSTNALLTGLDAIWSEFSNVVFVATSNFSQAIDDAFMSRVDLVVDVPVPTRDMARAILIDTMSEIRGHAEPASAEEEDALADVLKATDGLDARKLRKLLLQAIVENRSTALDPSALTWSDVRTTALNGAHLLGT